MPRTLGDPGVAAHRFGLGPRPGDLDRIGSDGVGWLKAQVGHQAALAHLETTDALLRDLLPRLQEDREEMRDALRARYIEEMSARNALAATTDAPFAERWVWFWTNHLCVSMQSKRDILPIVGAYEREAIRPNAWGRYEDLLLAATRHPAMLHYLDNARSIGPGSAAGMKRSRGLNENHAREILELHTLGVGGYTQADVEALARILTGWTVDPTTGRFLFDPRRHEPGRHRVLGRTYAAGDASDGVAALRDLARHPSTATHVATKLARHFVADDPPAEAVAALAEVFQRTTGNLHALALATIELPAAWTAPPKLRSPADLVLASARALGYTDGGPMLESMRYLGQAPFGAPSPQGWPDVAHEWLGPEAVLTRVEWADTVARETPGRDPVALARALFGADLDPTTRDAIRGPHGLALLLASPDFQRR